MRGRKKGKKKGKKQQEIEIPKALPPIPDGSSFSVIEAFSTHHFGNVTQVPPKVSRFAMREWKKLQDGLPKDIFVVSSSKHTHLFKALIVGPENTIYYNSYFIFDICLPNNYPGAPPKVYYCAAGNTLPPTFYDDGTVCLSLLGTWSGDQSERWNPSHSSIVQLVISLKALY